MNSFSKIKNKKLFYGIGAALTGVAILPKSSGVIASIYVFPSVMAGLFFGIALMEIMIFGKNQRQLRKAQEKNK
jgi:hypothetical protein